jgi:hypothetical protein
MMSLMVHYCDGFKVKQINRVAQYFYYLYLALILLVN